MSRPQAEPVVAVLTIAHQRHDHLVNQVRGLARGTQRPDLHVVVAMHDQELAGYRVPITTQEWTTVIGSEPASPEGLPLSAARNHAAALAAEQGAQVLIWLDVDCIPGPTLVERYTEVVLAGGRPGPALWCGEVGYLPQAPETGYPLHGLAELARAHPARPVLSPGQVRTESAFELFWSLSFAMSADDFGGSGGFCPDYVGYGGEDTDFAQVVKSAGGSLTWVGGAAAYHQHHESHSPPVGHVRDVVRNANLFYDRWGWWPMGGWLEDFAGLGLAQRSGPGQRWEATG